MGIPGHAGTGPVMGEMFWDNMDRLASAWRRRGWPGCLEYGRGADGQGRRSTECRRGPIRIAVLCVILLTCVKFDLGCGFCMSYHTLGLHDRLDDGGKQ